MRRHADPRDARASTLVITPRGQDTLERLRTESTLVLAASLQLLTAEQRSALAEALPVLELLAEPPGADPGRGASLTGGHAPRPLGIKAARPGGGLARHVPWSPRPAAAPAR